MRKQLRRPGVTLALGLVVSASMTSEALAQYAWPPRPPHRIARPQPSYAGDCGPNPPPGYRWDLTGWRTGFNRDFYCYVLDEY